MVQILLGNSLSTVYGLDTDQKKKIRDKLIYKSTGYQFTDAYRDGRWDGNRVLFWNDSVFPTGLVSVVAEIVGEVSIKDNRLRPDNGPGIRFSGQVRDYQTIEDKCIDYSRGIINFATGSGKTAVAARIIAKLDIPTLYIVPTKELLYQTRDELSRFLGITIGVIGGGVFETVEYVTVATNQSLWSVLNNKKHQFRDEVSKMIKSIQLMFIDEAQYLGADSFFKTAQAIDCYYKFGLTGTAFRSDDAGILLQAATGRVIDRISSSDLIRSGVLVKTKINMYRINSIAHYCGSDWDEIYDKGIVHNDIRNTIIVELVNQYVFQGLCTLIIVKNLIHGELLKESIQGSVYMHGSVSLEERKQALVDFKNGVIKVLIGTKIYDEGVDIPNMNRLIIAAAGKSSVKSLQRVGRALRKTSTKDNVVIVDFMDMFNPTLYRHSRARLSTYRTESEFEIEELNFEVEPNE